MKHFAQIQKEFVKQAKWTDLSELVQRRYLKKHPGSEKHLAPKHDIPKRLTYKGHPFISVGTVLDLLDYFGKKMMGDYVMPTEEEMKIVDPTIYDVARGEKQFLKEARKWSDMSLEDQKAYLKRHPKSKRRLTAKPSTDVTEKISDMRDLGAKFTELHNAASKEYKEAFARVGARMWHDDSAHPIGLANIDDYSIYDVRDRYSITRPLTVLDSYPKIKNNPNLMRQLNRDVEEIHNRYSKLWEKALKQIPTTKKGWKNKIKKEIADAKLTLKKNPWMKTEPGQMKIHIKELKDTIKELRKLMSEAKG